MIVDHCWGWPLGAAMTNGPRIGLLVCLHLPMASVRFPRPVGCMGMEPATSQNGRNSHRGCCCWKQNRIQIDHDIPVTSDFLAQHSVGAVKCNLLTCRVLCKAQCEDRYMHFYTPSYSGIRQELPSWSAIGPWLNHHNAPQFQGPIWVFGRPWFRHGLQMIVGQMTESNTLPND